MGLFAFSYIRIPYASQCFQILGIIFLFPVEQIENVYQMTVLQVLYRNLLAVFGFPKTSMPACLFLRKSSSSRSFFDAISSIFIICY